MNIKVVVVAVAVVAATSVLQVVVGWNDIEPYWSMVWAGHG